MKWRMGQNQHKMIMMTTMKKTKNLERSPRRNENGNKMKIIMKVGTIVLCHFFYIFNIYMYIFHNISGFESSKRRGKWFCWRNNRRDKRKRYIDSLFKNPLYCPRSPHIHSLFTVACAGVSTLTVKVHKYCFGKFLT